MLLVPFLWMIKFSGVLLERKEEMMIVNSIGDPNDALTVKRETFVWQEWARRQYQCRGVINLDFWINLERSVVGCRRKKKCCRLLSSKCQLLFSPVLFVASKVSHDAALASTTVTNFPLMEGAMEAFRIWKRIQCSWLRPLRYPYQCKRKKIMSDRYK